jgi:hypothetical protein
METYKIVALWFFSLAGTAMITFLLTENKCLKSHIKQEVRWLRKALKPDQEHSPKDPQW